MKKIITFFVTFILSIILYSPVFGQDKEEVMNDLISVYLKDDYSIYIPEGLNDEFSYLICDYEYTITKYSNAHNVNIRKYPNTESDILGELLYNTSVSVITEYDGWSCIGTEDGIAFVYSEYLSETELPKMVYTKEELYIMAHLLAGECQGYPDEEQLKVGSVVLNRVKSVRYPNTIKEVVFQKGQYSCTYDGNYYREPTERNLENARYLLEYGSILPEYVVFQARRKQGCGVYLRTEYHWYCY